MTKLNSIKLAGNALVTATKMGQLMHSMNEKREELNARFAAEFDAFYAVTKAEIEKGYVELAKQMSLPNIKQSHILDASHIEHGDMYLIPTGAPVDEAPQTDAMSATKPMGYIN